MKIECFEGCYGFNISLDGESVEDTPTLEYIANKIIENANNDNLKSIVKTLLEFEGIYKYDDEPCEQCGNTGYTITLEL